MSDSNQIMICGGLTGAHITDFYLIDLKQKRWIKPLNENCETIIGCSVASMGNKLIAFGGISLSEDSKLSSYDVGNDLFVSSILSINVNLSRSKSGHNFKIITLGDS